VPGINRTMLALRAGGLVPVGSPDVTHHDDVRRMARWQLIVLRGMLAVVAIRALVVGIPATFFPRSFYDDFPWFSSWVSLLPPYNDHLVAYVGGLQLCLGLLFAWGVPPSRSLILPLSVVWTVAAVHHRLFHITQLEGVPTADALGQTTLLAVYVVVPLIELRLALVHLRRGLD
jgi:hypothetical protein